jgi:hypothetical protein
MSDDPQRDAFRPFSTREAALCLLFDFIRRNAEIDSHHLRMLAELAELPASTGAAIETAHRASIVRA